MITGSIIIVNYNTSGITINAINSIIEKVSNLNNYEIIVVDNASELSDFLNLKSGIDAINLSNLILIKSKFNVGFGAGNMLAVQSAKGKYYIFMNSDVLLKDDSFSSMITFLENNIAVSIVGCQAVSESGDKFKAFDYKISFLTETFSNSVLQFFNRNKYPSRRITSKEPILVDAVGGSLFTCVAKDFESVGGFDTNLFLYYEEKDLAYRIQKRLKKTIYLLPSLEYIHLKGQSCGSSQAIKNELKISQFYAVKKTLHPLKYVLFYSVNFLTFLLKSPFSKKNFAYLKLLICGISVSKSIKHR